MSDRVKALGIDRLSLEERLALMQEIWDSIEEEQQVASLTPAQETELKRRLAAHKANPGNVIPWEQIKAEALARFQQ
jgi:putative addiction module component (TIGR02574 family)